MYNSLTNIVVPILDSRSVDLRKFENAEVFTGSIENEILPPNPPKCFLGAWYRKAVSSKDKWLGIEGVIKLGEFIPDENRYGVDTRINVERYLDNPSIYMGGCSLKETDAGLGFNISYFDGNTTEKLHYGSPKVAYRPFWRHIYSEVLDIDGNVTRKEINSWNVTDPRLLQYYYFPGDVIRMSVYSPIEDYLQLKIEIIEPTTMEKYVKIRNSYGLENNLPSNFYSPVFYSKGHGRELAEFKRVNSIDQYNNEGFRVKDTNAVVTEAYWKEVYLYRVVSGKVVKVPFNTSRQCSMICPNEKAITVSYDGVNKELGAEKIIIHPGKVNK